MNSFFKFLGVKVLALTLICSFVGISDARNNCNDRCDDRCDDRCSRDCDDRCCDPCVRPLALQDTTDSSATSDISRAVRNKYCPGGSPNPVVIPGSDSNFNSSFACGTCINYNDFNN